MRARPRLQKRVRCGTLFATTLDRLEADINIVLQSIKLDDFIDIKYSTSFCGEDTFIRGKVIYSAIIIFKEYIPKEVTNNE